MEPAGLAQGTRTDIGFRRYDHKRRKHGCSGCSCTHNIQPVGADNVLCTHNILGQKYPFQHRITEGQLFMNELSHYYGQYHS